MSVVRRLNGASSLIQSQARSYGPQVARGVAFGDVIRHWKRCEATPRNFSFLSSHFSFKTRPLGAPQSKIQNSKFKIQNPSSNRATQRPAILHSSFFTLHSHRAAPRRPKILHPPFSILNSPLSISPWDRNPTLHDSPIQWHLRPDASTSRFLFLCFVSFFFVA